MGWNSRLFDWCRLPDLSGQTGQLTVNPGDLWVISSSIGWAFYSLTLRKNQASFQVLAFSHTSSFLSRFNGLLLTINPFNEPPIAVTIETFTRSAMLQYLPHRAYIC